MKFPDRQRRCACVREYRQCMPHASRHLMSRCRLGTGGNSLTHAHLRDESETSSRIPRLVACAASRPSPYRSLSPQSCLADSSSSHYMDLQPELKGSALSDDQAQRPFDYSGHV